MASLFRLRDLMVLTVVFHSIIFLCWGEMKVETSSVCCNSQRPVSVYTGVQLVPLVPVLGCWHFLPWFHVRKMKSVYLPEVGRCLWALLGLSAIKGGRVPRLPSLAPASLPGALLIRPHSQGRKWQIWRSKTVDLHNCRTISYPQCTFFILISVGLGELLSFLAMWCGLLRKDFYLT